MKTDNPYFMATVSILEAEGLLKSAREDLTQKSGGTAATLLRGAMIKLAEAMAEVTAQVQRTTHWKAMREGQVDILERLWDDWQCCAEFRTGSGEHSEECGDSGDPNGRLVTAGDRGRQLSESIKKMIDNLSKP